MNKNTNALTKNLRIYTWAKLFTKRVYIPLTTIYLVEVGKLTLAQIGVLITLSATCSIAADIPSGFFADRFTRRASMVIGGSLLALESFILVLVPNFPGAICSTIAASVGFSFISGAGEALMHDTLAALGRVDSYVRVMGRAQSFSLIGNVFLVSIVPLTYVIDKRLPFVCGTIAALTFVLIAGSLYEPEREKIIHHKNIAIGINRSLRTFISRYSFLIFLSVGLLTAFYSVYGGFNNLVIKDLGLNPSLIGFLFAGGSIVGAGGGLLIHHIRRFTLFQYSLLDTALGTGTLVAIGVSHNLPVAIVFFVINLGFWRLRSIIYQDKLLRAFGNAGNKATLVSTLSFFDNANETWLPYVFVAATGTLGFYHGYTLLGSTAFIVLAIMFTAATVALKRRLIPAPVLPA